MDSVVKVKALGEEVRNWMRSGTTIFDLPRVVEELVLNSLDACAAKVSVYVGVGNCRVKVVDDGCGISRDGLVLLGERYATSKLHHMAGPDSTDQSFGSRGEALASISDVSLLEIVTRASGRPNGYRKVMKGSKCLYLGIDDDRKEVGTTVVVRDLFYNQPVRRKCMQSSSKKVLRSVKECVLRIALVQSKVFFKVVDAESDEELLNTSHSSAFLLLMNGFGIKDPSFFHQLNFSDGVLEISGYVSDPCDSFTSKAIQYVYINSRFVCKGPIHKLLNHLATQFECMDPCKADNRPQKGKRSRFQENLVYILNLSCPPYLYDLIFEPSRIYVEFKDWLPILAFTEKAIQKLWKRNIPQGGSICCAADMIEKDDVWKGNDIKEDFSQLSGSPRSKYDIQNSQSCHVFSPSLEMLTEEVGHIFNKQDKLSVQKFDMTVSQCKEPQDFMELDPSDDHLLLSDSFSKYICTKARNNERHLLTSHDKYAFQDHYYVKDTFAAAQRQDDQVKVGISSSYNKFGSSVVRNEAAESILTLHPHGLEVDDNGNEPFLQSCSSRRCWPCDKTVFPSEEDAEFLIDDFETKRRRVSADEDTHTKKIDVCDRRFAWTFLHDEPSYVNLSEASEEPFLFHGEPFAKEKDLAYYSLACTGSYSPQNHCLSSKFSVVTSDSFFQSTSWDAGYISDYNACEGTVSSGKLAEDWDSSADKGKGCKSSYDILSRNFGQDNCISCSLDSYNYGSPGNDICNFFEWRDWRNNFSSKHSGPWTDENNTNWLLFDSHSKDHVFSSQFKGQKIGEYPGLEHELVPDERFKRSHSAPPFCRHKKRFISLSHHSLNKSCKNEPELCHDALVPPETANSKHLDFQPNQVTDLVVGSRPDLNHEPQVMLNVKGVQIGETFGPLHHLFVQDSSVEGFVEKGSQKPMDSGTKLRNGCQQIAHNYTAKADTQDAILDISSGFLHLAGNSIVPGSLTKNFLEDAKALQQVDKKFIPVVAGGIIAVIDQRYPRAHRNTGQFWLPDQMMACPQHAADERIRLEELHQKVLSGEARTVTYLDTDQELILPEIGYQLLHDYAKQIREWGWICCNIQAQGSETFKKSLNVLHQRATVVTLLAVPCILGVNLSDGDLLEFLQQLADTDGSSTIPPSVLRVLNLKACRGAIMFGDSLLPSECALIVEELKQTSLCFQCAHGRPTTVPLVNLKVLHEHIAKLGVSHDRSCDLWHGLQRHELSLERAANRLSAARG